MEAYHTHSLIVPDSLSPVTREVSKTRCRKIKENLGCERDRDVRVTVLDEIWNRQVGLTSKLPRKLLRVKG